MIKNYRYKNLRQQIFTAGDTDQFEEHRSKQNGQNIIVCDIQNDRLKNDRNYHNLNHNCVDNTFQYIYNKFKKGIYVKIRDGKLETFLPFSKANFINEWGNRLKTTPAFNNSFNKTENENA